MLKGTVGGVYRLFRVQVIESWSTNCLGLRMDVFLTGGTGFIGSHVVMELVHRGHQVTILARNPDKIPAFRGMEQIELVQGSLGDMEVIRRGLRGKEACIHIGLNYREERDWRTLFDDTVPTVEMAACAAELGVKQFIYTSSTSVNDNLYFPENWSDPSAKINIDSSTAHTPSTYYGATKAACENYLSALSYQSDMRVNTIRPGYTFGNPVVEGAPTQGDDRFRKLVQAAMGHEPIQLCKTEGTQFIWAGDIAKVYADLLESQHNRKIYYALSAKFTTWAELAEEIIQKTASKSELTLTPPSSDGALVWDVDAIKNDFDHAFNSWPHLLDHVDYCIRQERV